MYILDDDNIDSFSLSLICYLHQSINQTIVVVVVVLFHSFMLWQQRKQHHGTAYKQMQSFVCVCVLALLFLSIIVVANTSFGRFVKHSTQQTGLFVLARAKWAIFKSDNNQQLYRAHLYSSWNKKKRQQRKEHNCRRLLLWQTSFVEQKKKSNEILYIVAFV